MTCRHYSCRCARAAELAEMAEHTGRADLLAEALAVHVQDVPCRLIDEQAALATGDSVR